MGLAPFFSFGKACRLYPLDRDSGTGRWDIGLRPHTGQKVLVEQGWERSGGWGGAKRIAEMELDGYAVGGLAVGESHEEMYHILEETVPCLPADKPTYLMGVGTPANILEGVERGVDFFDCVYPTRNGRHGHLYTNHGKINLFNAKYELDGRPIEEGCRCPACRRYSRAYIRHLLKAKEMLGMRLCVLHNLYFYNTMMEEIRDALDAGNFAVYKRRKLEGMSMGQESQDI